MKFIAAALLATVSAECLDGIKMGTYTDAKCETLMKGADGKEVEHTITEAELKLMNAKCSPVSAKDAAYWKAQKFDAKTMAVTCDTSKVSSTVYTEAECKGDKKEMSMTWGECKEFTVGQNSVYIKITGAVALQAAAAAALALVGSQF